MSFHVWRYLGAFISAAVLSSPAPLQADFEPLSSAAILHELKTFKEMGRVLYVAAHPDDENTFLITYLARGRHYQTAYLSVTRGDGGQNVLGSDFGEKLGLARTQELLAARKLDSGRQYFTRAIDFGFSKDYRETLNVWDEKEVLADMVFVIRQFKPDVIITRFSPRPSGTHGHHTASAYLAVEAFKKAADATYETRHPSEPWQAKRVVWNTSPGRSGPGTESKTDLLQIEAGGTDPVLGMPFSEIAGRSRAMHKTQGFDNFPIGSAGKRTEAFQLLAGEPAATDVMDGVDTTWARVPGGTAIGQMIEELIAAFDPAAPAKSVPALLNLRDKLAALPRSPEHQEKLIRLNRIILSSLGLTYRMAADRSDVVPGEKLAVRFLATLKTDAVPVEWVNLMTHRDIAAVKPIRIEPGQSFNQSLNYPIPSDHPLSHPYWLREEPAKGLFRIGTASASGIEPELRPVIKVHHGFVVGGQAIPLVDEIVHASGSGEAAASARPVEVVAPVSLHFSSPVELFARGATRQIEVEATAARDNIVGSLTLEVPQGWNLTPSNRPLNLERAGDRKRFAFELTAPSGQSTFDPSQNLVAEHASIRARAEINGVRYSNDRIDVRYKHLPPQLLQPAAQIKAVSFDLLKRGKRIGYLPGAGDTVDDALRQMGYEVVTLTGAELTADRLKDLDAVVIGVRAFNVREDLSSLDALFAYVEAGGTVVGQYNRPDRLQSKRFAPYSLTLSADRVTDENSAVTFLAPDHPVLNSPNKITQADFEGWVQERGIYYPKEWGPEWTPILAAGDAGEQRHKGGLLVAKHGKGYFVYTGLVFFRQLPAGVPGAYRLFANLVSLGK